MMAFNAQLIRRLLTSLLKSRLILKLILMML